MIRNSLCQGHVIHNRIRPKKHRFKYNMSWFLLNVNNLDKTFKTSKLWSRNRFNWVSLYDKDYMIEQSGTLEQKVTNYFSQNLKRPFAGEVFLFTHPRFLNFGFNSVSFYLAVENQKIVAIASEINNTPWNQQHIYFHKIEHGEPTFKFDKEFHISPFADMDIQYQWRFQIENNAFNVDMGLTQNNEKLLNVVLKTQRLDLTSHSLSLWSVKKPFQALKMLTGIYWQAFKLFLKRIPFYSHPQGTES